MAARRKIASRTRTAQLSIRIDEQLYEKYKQVLDVEGISITDDIENYLRGKTGETPLSLSDGNKVVDIDIYQLARDVENLKKQMGELQAS